MDKSRHHEFSGSLLCLGDESVNMGVHGLEGDHNLGRIIVMGVAVKCTSRESPFPFLMMHADGRQKMVAAESIGQTKTWGGVDCGFVSHQVIKDRWHSVEVMDPPKQHSSSARLVRFKNSARKCDIEDET